MIKAKKRLGQNFLIDPNIRRKIISHCRFSPDDAVIEIGSGNGEISALIAPLVGRLFAIEKDPRLYEELALTLKPYRHAKIICNDVLKCDFKKIYKGTAGKKGFKVVGNIPYYISTPILAHAFQFTDIIQDIYITVQKEFAERIAAKPNTKEYGSLTCFARYYSTARILFEISRHCFRPAPNVDSSFLHLAIRRKPLLENKKEEEVFFRIVRTAFNQRRKTLKNTLKKVVQKGILEYFLSHYGISATIRPEQLSLEDYLALAVFVSSTT